MVKVLLPVSVVWNKKIIVQANILSIQVMAIGAVVLTGEKVLTNVEVSLQVKDDYVEIREEGTVQNDIKKVI